MFTTLQYGYFHQNFATLRNFLWRWTFTLLVKRFTSLTFYSITLRNRMMLSHYRMGLGPHVGYRLPEHSPEPRIRTRFRKSSLGHSPRVIRCIRISKGQVYIGSSLPIIALMWTWQTLISQQVKLLSTLLVTYGKHMDIYVYAGLRFVPRICGVWPYSVVYDDEFLARGALT